MRTDFNMHLRMLLMSGYAMSLSLGSVQVAPQTSLPFLFALAFGGYKLYDIVAHHRRISIRPEVFVVVILYMYLIGAERFLHKDTILNAYFFSFGLNCVMLMLLADEFHRDSVVRDKVMRFYVAAVVTVAMFVTLDIMNTASQTGRLTFLGLNPNELAAALLIAYCWLSKEFMSTKWKLTGTRAILLVSAIVVLNALIVTGTRFALSGVIVVLLLLAISPLLDRNNVRNALIIVFVSGVFIGYKILAFSPMQDRLLPANQGNNLTDLGGRTLLWRNALDAFKESPLIGLGYDGYVKFVLTRERHFELPHNLPLEMAAIAGVVGIVLITVVGLILFWRVFVSGDRINLTYALIWSVPVLIMISAINITNLKIFWFVLAYFVTTDFSTRDGTLLTEGLPLHAAKSRISKSWKALSSLGKSA